MLRSSLINTLNQVRSFNKVAPKRAIYIIVNTQSRIASATYTPEIHGSQYIYARFISHGSLAMDLDYYFEHFTVELDYIDRLFDTIDDPACYV